jgi:hypothetical protein
VHANTSSVLIACLGHDVRTTWLGLGAFIWMIRQNKPRRAVSKTKIPRLVRAEAWPCAVFGAWKVSLTHCIVTYEKLDPFSDTYIYSVE